MKKNIPIGEAADLLGVAIQTLRRWDDIGILKSHRSSPTSYRFYTGEDLEHFLSANFKYLASSCHKWAFNNKETEILAQFYCPDKSVFKARLSKLELLLARDEYLKVGAKFSLITSVVGEIGNNSFDHNIGNWPDMRGIFFGYSLDERKIVLADRGQGVLATLKRVRTELSTHQKALEVAFTEYVSGRSPENRGNGLKYVRKIVTGGAEENSLKKLVLFFQSGDANVTIRYSSDVLNIKNVGDFNRGCFVLLQY